MVTTTREMPFEALLRETQVRHEDLNPVDRNTRLGKIRFILANPEDTKIAGVPNPLFVPRWALTAPDLESIPPVIEFSEHALKQFISLIDYKHSLLTRLRPDMAFEDINYLLENDVNDKMGFIRMCHGNEESITARAFMGGKFTPLDDLELLHVASEYLEGSEVRYHNFGSVSSHFTVTWPNQVREDGLEPALHIANSEYGVRSVTIQAALYRRICANVLPRVKMNGDIGYGHDGSIYERTASGARKGVVEAGFRFIHVGDADKLRGFVKDAVNDITNFQHETMFKEWDEGLKHRIENPADGIERMARMSRLAKDDLKALHNSYGEEVEASGLDFTNSATGIVNVATRAANERHDLESGTSYRWPVHWRFAL